MYAIPSYEDISVILPQYYRTPVLLDTTVTLNTDFFPWVSYGYFAGDYPAGITTLEGVPTDASITILTRAHGMRWDAMPVRRVKSGEDGIWRAEGIDPGLRYRVMGDKEGYNSVIADNVEPMNLPRFLPDRYEITVAKPFTIQPRIIGGVGDITATHTGGSLPQGVSFSDGEFTASWPTGPTGDYPLEFELADEAQQTNLAPITLALKLLPLHLSVTPPLILQPNEAIEPVIFTAHGGEGPYTFSTTGGVPSGLMFTDNEDGTATLSGTPDDEDDYDFTVEVEDVRSGQDTVDVSLTTKSDPHWADVRALLYLDGDLTDLSGYTEWQTLAGGHEFANGHYGRALRLPSADGAGLKSVDTLPGFGTGDFTIEFWFTYEKASNAEATLIDLRDGEANGFTIQKSDMHAKWGVYSSGAWKVPSNTMDFGDMSVLQHLAVARESGTVRIFVGGAKVSEFSEGGNFSNAFKPILFGNTRSGSHSMPGLIEMVRITKGVARYTSAFTPSAYPHPFY